MEYYAKKTATKPIEMHHVLADLCQQFDRAGGDEKEEVAEDENRSIFESILRQELTCSEVDTEDEDELQSPVPDTNYVCITSQACSIPSLTWFQGVCIDSAAQKSVKGLSQAQAYCNLFDILFQPSTTKVRNVFSFGTHKHPGLGTLDIRVPISPSHFLALSVDVVDTNVPFLLGLDNMERYKMVFDTDKSVLSSRLHGWTVPLRKKLGHLHYEWGPQILFTETELMRFISISIIRIPKDYMLS